MPYSQNESKLAKQNYVFCFYSDICVSGEPAVVDLISRREAIILEAAKSADFTVAKLKTAMGQIKDIH